MNRNSKDWLEHKWIIRLDSGKFYMLSPTGSTVECTGPATPRQLAKIAWEKGAWEVVFDFDLNLDPDK